MVLFTWILHMPMKATFTKHMLLKIHWHTTYYMNSLFMNIVHYLYNCIYLLNTEKHISKMENYLLRVCCKSLWMKWNLQCSTWQKARGCIFPCGQHALHFKPNYQQVNLPSAFIPSSFSAELDLLSHDTECYFQNERKRGLTAFSIQVG